MPLRFVAVLVLSIICSITAYADNGSDASKITVAKIDTDIPQDKIDIQRELLVNEKYQYYDIDGTTSSQLRRQMKEGGTKWSDGKVYAALTSWDIRYHYDITEKDGKYCISNVSTDVGIVYHLPRRVSTAADPMTQTWDSYYEHLKEHEFGHKDLAVKTAREINECLKALAPFADGRVLEREAKQLVRAKLERLKKAQVEYDDETRHGETQGALLP